MYYNDGSETLPDSAFANGEIFSTGILVENAPITPAKEGQKKTAV
jgi:hypothetical protein